MESVKTIFSKNLKKLIEDFGMDRRSFSERIGIGYSTVSEWILGKSYPRTEAIDQIANFFHVSVSDLTQKDFSNNFEKSIEQKKYPLLGRVACGEPILAEEDRDCFVMADADVKADFCLICKGDSMLPLIHDGDIIFVKKQEDVRDGEIAVIIIDDEATLKRVYRTGDTISLVAENKSFAPIVINANDNKSVRICGKAIFCQTLLN